MVAAGLLPVLVKGQTESPSSGGKSPAPDKPHPAMIGIDSLRPRILRGSNYLNADGLDWAQLYSQVTQKLDNAGVKLNTDIKESTPDGPELRIYVELLKLEDSPKRVFRVQTSLARAVCLTEKQNPVFKAELWQTSPAMQAVSADELPDVVMDAVLDQVEAFIHASGASNSRNGGLSDGRAKPMDSAISAEKNPGPDTGPAPTEYVASKGGSVFHRPECRWAQNISAENLIHYKNKEEASKDGKRPCKSCNP